MCREVEDRVGARRLQRLDHRGPALLRPTDVILQIPNVGRFVAASGWKPKYSFDDSLAHLLKYWRRKAAMEVATTR